MKISNSLEDQMSMTFSMDCLYRGFYLWIGAWSLRIGGYEREENYWYVVDTKINPVGFGIVIGFQDWLNFNTHKGVFRSAKEYKKALV